MTPSTSPLKKTVDFNALPNPKPCAFYQSRVVKRVTTAALAALSFVAASGAKWAHANFTAAPLTVIYTVRALVVLSVAFGVSAIALSCLPTSIKDPGYQQKLRADAGNKIQDGGEILAYPVIESRFQKLFDEGILVKQDIDALIFNELDKLDFQGFEKKHTSRAVAMLEEDTKQKLAEKYLASDFSRFHSLQELKDTFWVRNLPVSDKQLAYELFKDPARTTKIIQPGYTFEAFMEEYGECCISALSYPSREILAVKFRASVVSKSPTLAEVMGEPRKFCQKHFEPEVFKALLGDVSAAQNRKMVSGEVADYGHFRDYNGFAWLQKAASDVLFKAAARKAFLAMPGAAPLDAKYAQDRILLDVKTEDCITALNTLAEAQGYLMFKKTYGYSYVQYLSSELQELFRDVIVEHLENHPREMVEFKEEMETLKLTSDAVYLKRWNSYSLDNIIALDGPNFLALMKNPQVLKERFLTETQAMQAKEIVKKYPQLFRSGLFKSSDIPGKLNRSFAEMLEREVHGYPELAELAAAYGEGFYTSGLYSDSSVVKLVAGYLMADPATFLECETMPANLPMSIELGEIVRAKRQKLAAARQAVSNQLLELEQKHEAQVAQLASDAADLSGCKEKTALDEAQQADRENRAAQEQSHAEMQKAAGSLSTLAVKAASLRAKYKQDEEALKLLKQMFSVWPPKDTESKRDKLAQDLKALDEQIEILTLKVDRTADYPRLLEQRKTMQGDLEKLERDLIGPNKIKNDEAALLLLAQEIENLPFRDVQDKIKKLTLQKTEQKALSESILALLKESQAAFALAQEAKKLEGEKAIQKANQEFDLSKKKIQRENQTARRLIEEEFVNELQKVAATVS